MKLLEVLPDVQLCAALPQVCGWVFSTLLEFTVAWLLPAAADLCAFAVCVVVANTTTVTCALGASAAWDNRDQVTVTVPAVASSLSQTNMTTLVNWARVTDPLTNKTANASRPVDVQPSGVS